MSLGWIGPVELEWDSHLAPTFKFTSQPDAANARDAEIGGYLDWAKAEQLSELCANTDAMPTIAGRKGVLVPIWADDTKLNQFVGWYVLESFDLDADHESSLSDSPVGFTLKACYLGQSPNVVVARSSVPVGNDFALAATSVVVSPFRPADDAGDQFVTSPGGTFITREYDPTYPYDPAIQTPSDAANIGLYYGTVTDSTDDLTTVAFPALAWSKDAPTWLTQQGGNVRAYDRRAEREVYGPHPFLETTDLLITNGLLRAWVGNAGLAPFLNVEAFHSGSWREAGYVVLADPTGTDDVLVDARMVSVTPEEVVLAVRIQNGGDAFVSLRRGERMFRIVHGNGSVIASRQVRWTGLAPWSRLASATQGTGKFGKGIDGSTADFRVRLPAL